MSFAAALSQNFQGLLAWRAASVPAEPQKRTVSNSEQVAFTYALVALAAKVAACDGKPGAAEYAAFQQLFIAAGDPLAEKLKTQFVQQVEDKSSALQFARQIMNATFSQPGLHRDLLGRLVFLANADALPNAAELEMLRAIAGVLRISPEDFRAIVSRTLAPAGSPYEILGIAANASDEALREHYMERVRLLHPDRYQAAGASAETIAVLSEQLASLNAAYESVRAARARKSPGALLKRTRRNTKGATA